MILAIDSSTQWMGIALFQDEQILYEKVWRTNRRHTVELAPAIQTAISDCGMRVTDLHAVAVAIGPGSFTSLRIGLAVTKGLALSLHLPVVGIPTLDITAACQPIRDIPLIAPVESRPRPSGGPGIPRRIRSLAGTGRDQHNHRPGIGEQPFQRHAAVRRD